MSDPVFDSNSYISFDGTTLRDLIINRLNQGKVFTDQNYQGSNLSALIDVISYSFSTLLFYLNKTASESQFSESQIYENMNRIVKLLNYKPVGRLTQNVPFSMSANNNLPSGNYLIPRYSYITVGGTTYSFTQDINFSKITDGTEEIQDIINNYLLYQGSFLEYPLYTAIGIENEVAYLTLGSDVIVDHFNVQVYVKRQNESVWRQWTNVQELFLHETSDEVFEIRFNENKNYEIKFGDDINGKKLNAGDQVAIYYLSINPNAENIAPHALINNKIVSFNSVQFNNIIQDINSTASVSLNPRQLGYLSLDNEFPSTSYSSEENVDDIRKNAPKAFRSQYRLVTIPDYEIYIKSNFPNILADVRVVPNDDYLNNHIKYLYDIGLNSPQLQNQVLFNQIKFANSCNFNNLYIYGIPANENLEYLAPPQKELILNKLQGIKTITTQLVPMDPVYVHIDFCLNDPAKILSVNDVNNSKLRIFKSTTNRRSNSAILFDVKTVLQNTFNRSTNKLGQLVNLQQLNIDLLNVDGVNYIQTYRSDTDSYVNGISLLFWNPVYPTQDLTIHNQTVQLENFKYPIFDSIGSLDRRIEIVDNISSVNAVEF
jgi:hypothetical protein